MRKLFILPLVLSVTAFAWDEVPASLLAFLNDLNGTVTVPYEELLDSLPEVAGTITLHFDVMPDGALWNIEMEADSSLEVLIPVIRNAMDGAVIALEDPIMEPVSVTVPIVLMPGTD
jgi:hypothetical protein